MAHIIVIVTRRLCRNHVEKRGVGERLGERVGLYEIIRIENWSPDPY